MRVGEYCTKEVIAAEPSMDVGEVARLMRKEHVGAVVVVDASSGAQHPVGIVTDRDLVLEVLAQGTAPESLTLSDLLTRGLLVANEDDDLMDTLLRMRARGVRRIPVVDDRSVLQGILAVDDVLDTVASMLMNITAIFSREVGVEVKARS